MEKGKKYPIILRTVSRLRLFHPWSFIRSLSFIALTNVVCNYITLVMTCTFTAFMWCLRCIIFLVDTLNLWTVWCLVYLYKRVLSPIRRHLSTDFSDNPVPTLYHRLIHLLLWLAEPATHINFHMTALVRLLNLHVPLTSNKTINCKNWLIVVSLITKLFILVRSNFFNI